MAPRRRSCPWSAQATPDPFSTRSGTAPSANEPEFSSVSGPPLVDEAFLVSRVPRGQERYALQVSGATPQAQPAIAHSDPVGAPVRTTSSCSNAHCAQRCGCTLSFRTLAPTRIKTFRCALFLVWS